MFDMATISMGANLMSPMTGASVSMMGSMTPSADMKYSSVPSPHSPMSTPGSTPNSTFSNGGKSVSNSNSKDWDLLGNENELFGSKCKRKINFAHIGLPKGHLPQTVARRNARERNRVKQVNNGFAALKQHIPLGHRSKKMSKVETLKCAVDYIKNLKTMLDLNGALSSSSTPSSSSGNESNDVNHHFGPNNASEFVSSGDPLGHYHHHHHHPQHFGTSSASSSTVPAGSHQLSPSSSDDPSSPSYASEASYITSSNNNNNNNNANMYDFEKYEPVSPEDEELLDAISWWQQS